MRISLCVREKSLFMSRIANAPKRASAAVTVYNAVFIRFNKSLILPYPKKDKRKEHISPAGLYWSSLKYSPNLRQDMLSPVIFTIEHSIAI